MAWLSISEVAKRSGVATSTLRYYETQGLIFSERTAGNQRKYLQATLRRVAFVRAAQRVGLTLDEIRESLDLLPNNRNPTKADWAKLSKSWQPRIDQQIARLERLRDKLTSCIGCGCLSLRNCSLYNPDDAASTDGPGAVFLEPKPSKKHRE